MASKRDSRLVVEPIYARIARPGCKSDPRPYWRAVVYRDGKEVTVLTERGTKDEIKAILLDKVKNGDFAPQDANTGPVTTVEHLVSRWVGGLEEELGKDDGTFKAYRGRCKALKATIGQVRLDRVTPATLQDHVGSRARAGIRSTTIQNELVAFGAAWRWGFELDLVAQREPPVARPNKRRRRGRRREEGTTETVADARPKYTPTDVEVAAILRHLDGWPRIVGVICVCTGMRIGEVANLEWRDVDCERRTIHVRDVAGNKTGERSTPIPADLARELQAWRGEAGPEVRVIPAARATVAKNWTSNYLPAACTAAGVPRITAHAFRRYVTDLYANAKVDCKTSGAAMGNSPATQWKNYRTVKDADLQTAVKAAKIKIPTKGGVVPFPKAKVND